MFDTFPAKSWPTPSPGSPPDPPMLLPFTDVRLPNLEAHTVQWSGPPGAYGIDTRFTFPAAEHLPH